MEMIGIVLFIRALLIYMSKAGIYPVIRIEVAYISDRKKVKQKQVSETSASAENRSLSSTATSG